MGYGLFIKVLCLACWVTLIGCALPTVNSPKEKDKIPTPVIDKDFHAFPLSQCQPVAKVDGMVSKVDHFMMIFDPSASMTEPYAASNLCSTCHSSYADSTFVVSHLADHGGSEVDTKMSEALEQSCINCHRDFLHTKFKFAKELALCFNQSIPDLSFSGSLRSFGSPVYTQVAHGPIPYDRTQYDLALQNMIDVDGASPLALTFKSVTKKWFAAEGPMAVLIISDGRDMGEHEVMGAKQLVGRYGDRICLYTIQIGNDDTGKQVLEDIAAAGECGGMLNGDMLLDPKKMAEFTSQVFLKKAPAIADVDVDVDIDIDGDGDGDGVPDLRDSCPETKPNIEVDENGCWKLVVMADVLFDFDHHDLLPAGMAILDKVVNFMVETPMLNLAISGHTDNIGSQSYNEQLSRQRATAGQRYLITKGIAKERINSTWHSFNKPVASNNTMEGRALNRRIEFRFSKAP